MAESISSAVVAGHRHQPVNANKTHRDRMSPLDKAGVFITRVVGTMICAIAFAALALVSLPAALGSHSAIIIVAWIAQTFLQLVLLPIIMVGQNIQGKHTETMADVEFQTTQTTYKDLESLILLNQKQLDLLVKLAKDK